MNNFAMEAEEVFLEEVTLRLSLGKNKLGVQEAGKMRRGSPHRGNSMCKERYKVVEMHGIWRCLCVARTYAV